MTHEASFSQTLNHLDLRGIRLSSRQSRDFLDLGADQDDLEIGSHSRINISATAPIKITGFSSIGVQGRDVQLVNVGSNIITLAHLDGGSLVRNQLDNQSSADFAMDAKSVIDIFYDTVIDKWRVRIPGGIAGPAGPSSPTAATIVVNKTAGEGDATDIAAGIALLPAGGGTVYVEAGVYTLLASLVLTGKPIKIVGAGRGATTIDIGSVVGPVFSVTSDHKFSFESFTLRSTDGVALSTCWLTAPGTGPTTANPITIRDVDSSGIPVILNAGVASKWIVSDCDFEQGDIPGGIGPRFYTTASFAFLELTNVRAEVPGVPANGRGGGITNAPTVKATNCVLGGVWSCGPDSHLVNCAFTKADSLPTGGVIHVALGDNSSIVGCSVTGNVSVDPLRRFNAGNFCKVIGNTFGDGSIEVMRLNKQGSHFIGNKNLTVSFLTNGDDNIFVANEGMAGSDFSQGVNNIVDGVQMGASTGVGEGMAKANLNTTGVGNVGVGEDDLITYVLPADALSKVASGIEIKAWGTAANNANVKTLRLKLGGTTILTTILTASQAGFWEINAIVAKTGASTQDVNASLVESPGTLHDVESGTAAETDTAAIVVKCTGDATANDDIRQEGLLVKLMN